MRSRFCSPISLRGRLPSLANSGLGLPLGNGDDCSCWCRPPLVRLDAGDRRSNRSMGVGSVADCLLPCSNPFFSDDEQWFASLWVALWAAIAALSSALTFATFLIDRPRFRFLSNSISHSFFFPSRVPNVSWNFFGSFLVLISVKKMHDNAG